MILHSEHKFLNSMAFLYNISAVTEVNIYSFNLVSAVPQQCKHNTLRRAKLLIGFSMVHQQGSVKNSHSILVVSDPV